MLYEIKKALEQGSGGKTVEEYYVFVKGMQVFLVKEDHHYALELKERVYRYDEQMKGERQ